MADNSNIAAVCGHIAKLSYGLVKNTAMPMLQLTGKEKLETLSWDNWNNV